MAEPASEFINHLREEKLKAQESRSHLTVQKLTFATTLLGLSFIDIKTGNLNVSLLFFLVPWVAIVFDFYIMGEDYSVKRIGGFLRKNSESDLEKQWEKLMPQMRDPFAPLAMPILTTFLLIGSLIIGLQNVKNNAVPLWVVIAWTALSLVVPWGLFLAYNRLRDKVNKVFGDPDTISQAKPGSREQPGRAS